MRTIVVYAVATIMILAPSFGSAVGRAQAPEAPPDFSGVYHRIQPFGPPAPNAGREDAPPIPTRSAPTSDGRRGRAENAPKLTAPYLAQWEIMRASRMAGSPEFDPSHQCLPAGMPSMMNMVYGMEVMQTNDKVTIYGELNDMYRRIFLDGRTPSPEVLDDPTYAGYSTGRWEGDTLVVETVALRGDTLLDSFSPHSDKMTVRERIRLLEPGLLEDRITVFDPEALLEPYEMVRTYRKATPPDDELREFACAEGLADAK